MIVRSDAVVLSGMDYRDTSRICVLYTREFGRQTVIAKGARGGKPRFGGALQALNVVHAVYYRKEHHELHHLSQCDLVFPWRGLTRDLERMSAGMAIVELLAAVTPEEERNIELYELLVASLGAADGAESNAVNARFLFEIRLLGLLGFRPEFGVCAGCGEEIGSEGEELLGLELSRGGVYCSLCSRAGHGLERASHGAVNVIRRFQEIGAIDTVSRLSLSPKLSAEIGGILRRLLQSHVEGLKPLRSEGVFAHLQ
jgi:DNA repair protein RecO (recombination protein O)